MSEGKEHQYKIQIQEHHLDTFGHVNNATYLQLFEQARWDMITTNGYGLEQIHQQQRGPIVLGCQIKFLKEIVNRDTITIVTQAVKHGSRVSDVSQFMKKDNGHIACKAHFQFGLFDMKKRKLIESTPEWRHAIGLT